MQASRSLRGRPPPPSSHSPSTSGTEMIQWDSKTFQVPKKIFETATPQEKSQYLTATLNGVRAGNATHSTKLSVLNSRFDYVTMIREVNVSLKTILDLTTDQESPNIVLTNSASVFSLQDPHLSTLACKPLNLPLVPATRSTAYHYSFQVILNARNAYSGNSERAKEANFAEIVFIVTVAACCYRSKCIGVIVGHCVHYRRVAKPQQHASNDPRYHRISSCTRYSQEDELWHDVDS